MKKSNNPAKYEVLIKQYLRSILDVSADKIVSGSLNVTIAKFGGKCVILLTSLTIDVGFNKIPLRNVLNVLQFFQFSSIVVEVASSSDIFSDLFS